VALQATEADNNLRQKFQKIIQRTQIQHLKLLKVHHNVMRETLGNKIFNLERDIMHHRWPQHSLGQMKLCRLRLLT